MGRAQVMQAEAAGIEPSADMNLSDYVMIVTESKTIYE